MNESNGACDLNSGRIGHKVNHKCAIHDQSLAFCVTKVISTKLGMKNCKRYVFSGNISL